MNRDDITRMAREAGFQTLLPDEHIDGKGGVYVGDDDIAEFLERFAALVAAAERERTARLVADMQAELRRLRSSSAEGRQSVWSE